MAAGCGGEKRATTTPAVPPRTATPNAANLCLGSDAFLVDVAGRRISGSSPGGANLTVTFYKSPAAAKAALARLDPAYARAIGSAVVNYSGNPPLHPGAKPMGLTHDELATLRHCIEIRRRQG